MSSHTPRRTGAERRQEIAHAALQIIGSRGLTALTTSTLAKHVGVTSGALFRHFGSFEEILEEAVRRAEEQVMATFPDTALPPLERLRELARARIALLSGESGLAWLLRSQQALLTMPPGAVKRLRSLVRRTRAFIRRALDDAIAARLVRTDVPRDVLLLTYTATVHALIERRTPHGSKARSTARAVDGLLLLLAPSGSPGRRG